MKNRYAKQLFQMPKDLNFTKLCIWIDENFYKESCDLSTAYSYIWIICKMLAKQAKYFNNEEDYEEFACILATIVFNRMRDESRSNIRHVLPYIKSIMYFKKCAYLKKKHEEVINPEYEENWDTTEYLEQQRLALEKANQNVVIKNMCYVLGEIPNIIDESIPKVFKLNKLEYKNLYTTCSLNMFNQITLTRVFEDRLDSRFERYPEFDAPKFFQLHKDTKIILWDLPEEYRSVVNCVLNKARKKIASNIKNLVGEAHISDEVLKDILDSPWEGGSKCDNS